MRRLAAAWSRKRSKLFTPGWTPTENAWMIYVNAQPLASRPLEPDSAAILAFWR
jgi:hypothetical protein